MRFFVVTCFASVSIPALCNACLPETHAEGDNDTEHSKTAEELAKLDPERCESCYGSETKDSPCCNTCEAVREAYRKKGWAFNNADGIVQCEREGW